MHHLKKMQLVCLVDLLLLKIVDVVDVVDPKRVVDVACNH